MKKIVITGGLGYIGSELCKLYSGLSWKYEILAIDKRFVSERVNELKRRKIKFIQADILNIEEIRPHIKDADTIFVLDDGKLVESGTHSELMKKKKYYANMVKTQNKEN